MSEFSQYISSAEEIIEDTRNGKMIVLVDAEDRENEGDLIIPAQMATPDAINFMAKFGRGLICLTLMKDRADQLGLELMSQNNRSRHQTAFTVSIEAREGISTGISAHDRSKTVSVAIDPTKSMQDIVSPGHVFPLVARDGGVLMRAGHTEASVDIARLAGLYPAGVICEIMNDDGTMARLPDLVQFAQIHGLKLGTIADLIAYRRRNDTLVQQIHQDRFKLANGSEMKAHIYLNTIANEEHIALVKGDISGPEPVLTRFHAENLVADIAGSGMPRAGVFQQALEKIDEEGRGVLVIIRNTSPTPFTDSLNPQPTGDPMPTRLLDYGIGAQIVADLGLREIELLSDTPRTVVALEGYDLKIVGQRPINGNK
ncbi:3,4-dihydroxy-2-butanone-4-phosphate synthase [Alphaproteobacteria bacterium]|nr:3,4-dihydroxy-2-butanone-4-phosphate synthase [Rhodobiaceae bacterium]MDA8544634.1 3,4-dihydroxy-2-butanone-4-phosphate synthase [Alphaproteobacteria bacterium]OUV21331.1 MAG: 3,4-dihydroxy-2-butanone-4-phosphate synthase [Gammaproteobacteria bacterium TMED95]RPF96091.1 MAG: 3,4-dihydroxy-2-butanone-4-phosphate synthase [Rhizobiales bacterium TMED162]MDA8625597.1 3,4-dihydroxy-2-butanone-4-phosphate synthase [Alphaproteobacteria bacterium]